MCISLCYHVQYHYFMTANICISSIDDNKSSRESSILFKGVCVTVCGCIKHNTYMYDVFLCLYFLQAPVEDSPVTMPYTTVAYQHYLSFGKVIDLYEWMQVCNLELGWAF